MVLPAAVAAGATLLINEIFGDTDSVQDSSGALLDWLPDIVQDIGRIGPGIPFIDLFSANGETPAELPHGPVVKTWTAGVTPFVLTQSGWIGARRKNGTWSWYKPRKPVVLIPGRPLKAGQARKLAKIYDKDRKQAKKLYGLVDKSSGSRPKSAGRVIGRTVSGDPVVEA
jgi:hypothetical protein